MAQRRLARLAEAGGGLTVNWIVQATATYDVDDPGADPENWGTEAEIGYLDRAFTATGNEVTHDGMLLTFLAAPDRAFYGAQVKVRPTFTNTVDPKLEVWTLKDTTWTIRRRVALTGIARSGDTLILDLTLDTPLFQSDDAMPDAVWITLDTLTDTSLTWLACHLYGDCTQDPVTPDCPPGTPPEDCDDVECSAEEIAFTCVPLPVPPDLPNPAPVNLPPIDVNILMPETYTQDADGHYVHDCPGPNAIRMYFGDLPGGGSVRVDLIGFGGVIFAEGTSQTISAVGIMDWNVAQGFGPANPAIGDGSGNGYLPPREVLDHLTFRFTRIVADPADQITLLDILMYFWTYDLKYEEVCALEPVAGLPPAQDPPDDAGQTDYQRVYERWLVYADTEEHADLALAAEAKRVAMYHRYYDINNRPNYGLRPDDALLFQNALDNTSAYLAATFDPNIFVSGQHTGLRLPFTGLADGHVLAFRLFVVPVAQLLAIPSTKGGRPRFVNPFATARTGLPYNPALDVQTIDCDVSSPCSTPFDSDLGQRFRFFRNFDVTPQITKFGGAAIQTGAYHLARGVTEQTLYDVIGVHPYPSSSNPYAHQWDPCGILASFRCHQWFTSGWALLLTIRVYEPVLTPIGGTVSLSPPVANPSTFHTFTVQTTVAGGLLELDGRWP